VLIVAYGAAVVLANRLPRSSPETLAVHQGTSPVRPAGSVRILIWNVAYAGLGAESDFKMDGGENWLPPSREVVAKNLAGIVDTLARSPAEILLLQEVVDAIPLNYGTDVGGAIAGRLAGLSRVEDFEIVTRLVPPPLRIRHGKWTFSRLAIAAAQYLPLPLEPVRYLGLFRRNYNLQVTRYRLAGTKELVVANIHMSAYDAGGETRHQQIAAAMAWANAEHAKGNLVIMGGDWNARLIKSDFPHTTDTKHLWWVVQFAESMLPAGWRLIADAKVASVRALHQPFREGETYTTTIDGFVVSPNVTVKSLTTLDQRFRFADHQPVLIEIELAAE
jgi:endonuclease/exonuclease/phosphatase family metal-dependent hydrolase